MFVVQNQHPNTKEKNANINQQVTNPPPRQPDVPELKMVLHSDACCDVAQGVGRRELVTRTRVNLDYLSVIRNRIKKSPAVFDCRTLQLW